MITTFECIDNLKFFEVICIKDFYWNNSLMCVLNEFYMVEVLEREFYKGKYYYDIFSISIDGGHSYRYIFTFYEIDEFKKHFISIVEHRNKKINNILE